MNRIDARLNLRIDKQHVGHKNNGEFQIARVIAFCPKKLHIDSERESCQRQWRIFDPK